MTTKTKTLVEKLVAVRESVGGYVQKKGRNTAQSYNFASEADITSRIYPAFAAEGILFYPESRRVVEVLEYTTAKGGKMMMTTTEAKWVATDGVDRIEVMTIGQGADSGDKGAYKGMAGDKKYAILQLLGIATGDDPETARPGEEHENEQPPAAQPTGQHSPTDKATQPQLNKMFAMAKNVGIDLGTEEGKTTLKAIVLAATGKKSSSQLTSGDMDGIYKTLESQASSVAA